MTKHPIAFACLAVMLANFLTGCERSEEKTLPAEPPLTQVTVRSFTPFRGISSWSQTVTIHIVKATEISNLLDLRVFGNLQPGTTNEQVESRLGKPNQTRTDDFGTTWYSYKTALGRAEVGCDKRTSPAERGKEVANAPCWWALYAYTDQPVTNIFREPVLSQSAQSRRNEVGGG